jgi:hypothetical protein
MSARLAPALHAALLPVGLAALVCAAPARADDVGGSVVGQLVVADGDLGGAATLDLWAPIGPLRLGGFFGVGATPSARDRYNRTYMPLGAAASLALDVGGGTFVSIVARAGLWGGATQDAKLTIGGLVGGGAYLDVGLGGGVTLGGGVEAWGLFGAGDTWAVLPGLRMTWGQPLETTAAEETAAGETAADGAGA